MTTAIDGVLVQWGDRLFYSANRRKASHTPAMTGLALQKRAQVLRQRIRATVVQRAPQVMVKVTGGGRGMGAIAAHLRYITKGGRLPVEDDRGVARGGKEALQAIIDQWRYSGSRFPEVSDRREAFNIMLSMPAGTKASVVQLAASEFAHIELRNHQYAMVLHTHQANPHVHISVRAEGRDGKRLNPRKEDLHRWRETFAQRLRDWGIEAEATSQAVRGSRHREQRAWSRGKRNDPRSISAADQSPPKMSPSHRKAGEAWARIAQALASSPEPEDRQLSSAIVRYVRDMPIMRGVLARPDVQRELPGMTRSHALPVTRARSGPEIER